jgi:hypothetical protein
MVRKTMVLKLKFFTLTFSILILHLVRQILQKARKKGINFDTRRQLLLSKISNHYGRAVELFPYMSDCEMQTPRIALPSACSFSNQGDPQLLKFSDCELQLRVGHGHDILQKLRTAAGLHNYYVRKQKKETRGLKNMTKVSNSQRAASAKKSTLISEYNQNWKLICKIFDLLSPSSEDRILKLKGLQELQDSDVRFFEEEGTQPSSYMVHTGLHVTWIWKVAMLDHPESNKILQRGSEEIAHDWENEGALFLYSFLD